MRPKIKQARPSTRSYRVQVGVRIREWAACYRGVGAVDTPVEQLPAGENNYYEYYQYKRPEKAFSRWGFCCACREFLLLRRLWWRRWFCQ